MGLLIWVRSLGAKNGFTRIAKQVNDKIKEQKNTMKGDVTEEVQAKQKKLNNSIKASVEGLKNTIKKVKATFSAKGLQNMM